MSRKYNTFDRLEENNYTRVKRNREINNICDKITVLDKTKRSIKSIQIIDDY